MAISKVLISVWKWGTIEEGQTLLREPKIRRAVFEPQFLRPDRTLFTEELKNRLILQGPPGWNGALAALPSPLVGQGLYKGGKALVDMSDLDQHAQSVCKVREQPTGEVKRQNERTGLSAIFKDMW